MKKGIDYPMKRGIICSNSTPRVLFSYPLVFMVLVVLYVISTLHEAWFVLSDADCVKRWPPGRGNQPYYTKLLKYR